MEVLARFSSLAVFLSLTCHVVCVSINHGTASTNVTVDLEIVDDWTRLVQEGGVVDEVVVSSQPVQLTKRSDSDSDVTVEPPKKKPIMYSWWMPNMAMGGKTPISVTSSPSLETNSESQSMETTTAGLKENTTRPTRKPRRTLRPKDRKPTSSLSPSSSSEEQSTQSAPKVTTIITTETTPSSHLNALTIKKKLVNIAKIVGGVALIAKGAAGNIALSTTGVQPYVQIAGKVGSLAVTAAGHAGSLAAPVAKTVALKAGSLAVSALSKAGSLAVTGAGRAYEAISTRITSHRAQGRELKMVNDGKTNTEQVSVVSMSTRAIKTSPDPEMHKNNASVTKSPQSDVEMDVVMNKGYSEGKIHREGPQSKQPESGPEETEMRDVLKMQMSTRGGEKSESSEKDMDEKSFGVSNIAELLVVCFTLGLNFLINELYLY